MSWTKNLSIILMINNKGQLWVSSIKNLLDRQGIYSALLISLMGEANGLCTESYECLIKKFNWSVSLIYIAITRDLAILFSKIMYSKITSEQNIISLHGEIVKSVFFVKSVRLTVSLVFLSKILFSQEVTQLLAGDIRGYLG